MGHSIFPKVDPETHFSFWKNKQANTCSLSSLYTFVLVYFYFFPSFFYKLLLILLEPAPVLSFTVYNIDTAPTSPLTHLHDTLFWHCWQQCFTEMDLLYGSMLCRRCKAAVMAHWPFYPSHPAQCLEYTLCSINNFLQSEWMLNEWIITDVSYYF